MLLKVKLLFESLSLVIVVFTPCMGSKTVIRQELK